MGGLHVFSHGLFFYLLKQSSKKGEKGEGGR